MEIGGAWLMLNVHVRERDGNQSMINPNNIPAAAARWRHSALYHLLLQLANLFLQYTLLHKGPNKTIAIV